MKFNIAVYSKHTKFLLNPEFNRTKIQKNELKCTKVRRTLQELQSHIKKNITEQTHGKTQLRHFKIDELHTIH